MAKRTRLKVFQAQFGFYDTVVAASSQAAALRAWGIHQNLFASGQAKATTEEAAIKAALEHPETPLRRPIGSKAPFALDPTGIPDIPDEPRTATEKRTKTEAGKPAGKPAPRQPPPDRAALSAAEAALHKVEQDRKREEQRWEVRSAELEQERQAAQQAYVKRRNAAAEALASARRAYRAAGGKT